MSNFTPTTKRIMVGGIVLIGIGIVSGWSFGQIDPKDGSLIIVAIITGFCGLLKGVE